MELHGLNYTSEHNIWAKMKNRCHCTTNDAYKYYGAKGITVCDEWRNSFMAFYKDMGVRPYDTTLDRIDNTKGYSKSNCRWATRVEQERNKSNTLYVDFRGIKISFPELCELCRKSYDNVFRRYHRMKLDIETALSGGRPYIPRFDEKLDILEKSLKDKLIVKNTEIYGA
jgi:hypothetical protein